MRKRKEDTILKIQLEEKHARGELSFEDMGALAMIRSDPTMARGGKKGSSAFAFGCLGYFMVPIAVAVIIAILNALKIIHWDNAEVYYVVITGAGAAGLVMGVIYAIFWRKRKFEQLNDLNELRAAFKERICKKRKIKPEDADAYFAFIEALPEIKNNSVDGAVIRTDGHVLMAFNGPKIGVCDLDKDTIATIDHKGRIIYGDLWLGAYPTLGESWKMLKQLKEITGNYRFTMPEVAFTTAMLNAVGVMNRKIAELSGIKTTSLNWHTDLDSKAIKEAKTRNDPAYLNRMKQLVNIKKSIHWAMLDDENGYYTFYPGAAKKAKELADIRRYDPDITQMQMLQIVLKGSEGFDKNSLDPELKTIDLGFEQILYPELEYLK